MVDRVVCHPIDNKSNQNLAGMLCKQFFKYIGHKDIYMKFEQNQTSVMHINKLK